MCFNCASYLVESMLFLFDSCRCRSLLLLSAAVPFRSVQILCMSLRTTCRPFSSLLFHFVSYHVLSFSFLIPSISTLLLFSVSAQCMSVHRLSSPFRFLESLIVASPSRFCTIPLFSFAHHHGSTPRHFFSIQTPRLSSLPLRYVALRRICRLLSSFPSLRQSLLLPSVQFLLWFVHSYHLNPVPLQVDSFRRYLRRSISVHPISFQFHNLSIQSFTVLFCSSPFPF